MEPVIRCEGLVKNYGRTRVLNLDQLAVPPGVCGLLGPNGAGKSTLISILLGQTPPSTGRVEVLGLELNQSLHEIRRRVGYMPENDCLIPGLTGTGYVYYCGRLSGLSHSQSMQRAHEVLDYVGLEEARYRKAEQYSTGMKQRLKLAQAIVHDPDLVFLDEPTNGLDPKGRELMLRLVEEIGATGISVLISSHLLPDVERVSEHLLILGRGELLEAGPLQELKSPDPYEYSVQISSIEAGSEHSARGAFFEELGRFELEPQTEGATLQIRIREDQTSKVLFEAAQRARVRIIELKLRESTLNEAFLEAIGRGTA